MGRLIATILPDSSRDLSDYDRSGKIMTYTDRNGVIQQYQYDKLGRMISLNINDTNILSGLELKGSHTKISSYDALGRIISIENEFCKYSFEYNSLGLLTKEVITYISPDNQNNHAQFIILRKYNMSGALSEIVYPSGRKIQYSRDILDRIISIEQVTKGLSYPGDDSIPENFVIMEVEYEGLQRKIIKRHNQTSTRIPLRWWRSHDRNKT